MASSDSQVPPLTLAQVVTSSFIERGANVQYLSAFPGEAEFLYPPLTYLRPTRREDTITIGAVEYKVVEVEPRQ